MIDIVRLKQSAVNVCAPACVLALAVVVALPAEAAEGAAVPAKKPWATIVRSTAPQPTSTLPAWGVTRVVLARLRPSLPASTKHAALSGAKLEGLASFYHENQMTANGERFDPASLTAAHTTLPFNSHVKVTNVINGRSVIVRINDRGPYVGGRIIDVSQKAAQLLGMTQSGIANVKLQVMP